MGSFFRRNGKADTENGPKDRIYLWQADGMSRPEETLTYARPATTWLEALPLGNGRLAAMVFGGTAGQRIQVNDASAWSGSPSTEGLEPVDPERFARTLAEVRSLLAGGELVEADRVARGLQHRHSQAYLPFGDLDVVVGPHGEATGYRRELDLSSGVHTERYDVDDASVTWTSFVDRESSVLVVRMQTDLAAGLDVSFGLSSPLRVLDTHLLTEGIEVTVRMPSDVYPPHERSGGVSYSDDPTLALQGALAVTLRHDGAASTSEERVEVTGAHDLVLLLATQTTAGSVGEAPSGDAVSVLAAVRERLELVERSDHSTLLASHQAAHAVLYDRVALRISPSRADGEGRPAEESTDARLLAANAHPDGALAADPGLAELLFNYGRYLLLSSPAGCPRPCRVCGTRSCRPRGAPTTP